MVTKSSKLKMLDIVRLYDGNSTSSPIIGNFTGNIIPATQFTSKPHIFITFTVNSNQTAPGTFYQVFLVFNLEGFRALWRSYVGKPPIGVNCPVNSVTYFETAGIYQKSSRNSLSKEQ